MDQPDRLDIPFDAVPSATRRRDGWTEARQRAFIAALARCGSVTAAARQVGKSPRGAYALREREGADSFADAWALAVEIGIDATRDCVIDRAMHGGWVPVVRRGRIVRMEFRHFDRLALGLLSGRGAGIEANLAERARQRAYRQALKAHDRRISAGQQAQASFEEEYHRQLDEARKTARAARFNPRIIPL